MSEKEVFPLPTIQTTILVSIALYNVAELTAIIFTTFKSFCGLYFWSFLLSSWGIAIYIIGFMLKTYHLSTNSTLFVTTIVVGWMLMVSGQALVLYSRLHYLLKNIATLRIIFAMIIVNGTIGHIPIIAMIYGAELSNPAAYIMPLLFYEKVQVTIFFLQSVIISGLYIFHSVKILREDSDAHIKPFLRVLKHLIYLNAILILLDISILAFEWSSRHTISSIYKAAAYSIKLKFEFSVFNRLNDDILSSPSIKSVIETDMEQRRSMNHHQAINLETFYGRTQILENSVTKVERCHEHITSTNSNLPAGEQVGKCYEQITSNNSNFPAGEAFRSHLNDAFTTRTASSTLEGWADDVSDGEDFESVYARSRRTTSTYAGLAREVQVGLSPTPRSQRGEV